VSSSQELTDSRLNQLPDGLRVVGKVELTRRRFGARVAKLGVLAATIAGGIVGFAPSAQAIVCIPGTKGPLAVAIQPEWARACDQRVRIG